MMTHREMLDFLTKTFESDGILDEPTNPLDMLDIAGIKENSFSTAYFLVLTNTEQSFSNPPIVGRDCT